MEVAIKVEARFTTPFSVGTGAVADVLANKPLFKDGRDRPVIPGSAFKGRLRHTCEQLLRALANNDALVCHSPGPEASCPFDPANLGGFCPICRLFGSPHRAGPLVFSDLRWAWPQVAIPPTDVRSGVSIGRKRRVAEPGRLYDVETFAPLPEIHYQGQITGYLAESELEAQALAALLWAGLRDLRALGGGRGRGLGRCQITAAIHANGRRVDVEWLKEGLAQWLA